jgi:hypothetical protein
MTSTDGSYQFSMEMDDLISTTPYTRSSNRNRKLTLTKEKIIIQKLDNDMCATRSSQKSPLTSNDDSFMSHLNSGFSQFTNPKKQEHLNVLKVHIPLFCSVFLFIRFSCSIC